jgi:hypothetical protein
MGRRDEYLRFLAADVHSAPMIDGNILPERSWLGLHETCGRVLVLVAPILGGPARREAGPLLWPLL